jgi:superfamily II helicase
MSAEEDLEGYNQNHDFLHGVVSFIEENEKFRGTATELSEVLGLSDINPRVLSLNLEKIKSELENHGIFVKHSITRGRHLVTITNTHRVTHSETNLRYPTQHTPLGGVAKPEEPITFPFSWLYADIVELPEEEKNEINKVRHHGRKHYQKTCAICGKEGNLQFRKTSDGNSSCLICNPCAEKYVNSAIKLQLNGVGEM